MVRRGPYVAPPVGEPVLELGVVEGADCVAHVALVGKVHHADQAVAVADHLGVRHVTAAMIAGLGFRV